MILVDEFKECSFGIDNSLSEKGFAMDISCKTVHAKIRLSPRQCRMLRDHLSKMIKDDEGKTNSNAAT